MDLKDIMTRLRTRTGNSRAFTNLLNWVEQKRPMFRHAGGKLASARVADLAAEEPVKVEVLVERLGAGQISYSLSSNLPIDKHLEMVSVVCPDMTAQMEKAGKLEE